MAHPFGTDGRIAGNQFANWAAIAQCRRVTRALTKALNAAFASRRIEWDVSSLAEEQRQIAIIWNIEDVQQVRPDLDEDRAWAVLQLAASQHDASLGIQWDTLEAAAESLYSNAPEQGGIHA